MDTQKKQFQFALDEEVILWERSYFTVEAETVEEAQAKVMQAIRLGKLGSEFEVDDYETLYGTEHTTGKIEVISFDRPSDSYRTEQTIYFTEA